MVTKQIDIVRLREKATELYNIKIRSGKYENYPPKALEMLFDDCVHQAAVMLSLNGGGAN